MMRSPMPARSTQLPCAQAHARPSAITIDARLEPPVALGSETTSGVSRSRPNRRRTTWDATCLRVGRPGDLISSGQAARRRRPSPMGKACISRRPWPRSSIGGLLLRAPQSSERASSIGRCRKLARPTHQRSKVTRCWSAPLIAVGSRRPHAGMPGARRRYLDLRPQGRA
jgi:hypothetical protein